MKKLMEKWKKWLSKKPVCYWILGIEILLLIILFLYCIDIYGWLGLEEEGTAEFYRNRGFFVAGITGLILTAIGMLLTFWGRWLTNKQTKQTQKQIEQTKKQIKQSQEQLELSRKFNADGRYENAARMLGDDVLTVRIAGCHALRSLGIEDLKNFEGISFDIDEHMEVKTMATQCMDLLLAYICNPYLDNKQKDEIEEHKRKKYEEEMYEEEMYEEEIEEEYLEIIFPKDTELRLDINAAIKACSDICEGYYEKNKTINLEKFDLPSYFWRNRYKGKVSIPNSEIKSIDLKDAYLADANLSGAKFEPPNSGHANFQEAILSHSNLIKTNFSGAKLIDAKLILANLWNADLSEADLQDAVLSEACLSGAKMSNAKNLTKKQVLSATWWNEMLAEMNEKQVPPELPEELLQDEEIQKWLKDPNYNKKT